MTKTKRLPEAKDVDYYFDGGCMVIPSSSLPEVKYHVTEDSCPCPASGICWHMKFRKKVREDIIMSMLSAGSKRADILESQGDNFPEIRQMPAEYWIAEPYESDLVDEDAESDLIRKLEADKEKVKAFDALYVAERAGWRLSRLDPDYQGIYTCKLRRYSKPNRKNRFETTNFAKGVGSTAEKALLKAVEDALAPEEEDEPMDD